MEVSGHLHGQLLYPWYPLARRMDEPRADLNVVVEKKIPITAPTGIWNPVVQPIAQFLYWVTWGVIKIFQTGCEVMLLKLLQSSFKHYTPKQICDKLFNFQNLWV